MLAETHHMQAFAVVYIVLAIILTRLGLGLPFDLLPKANLELYTLVCRLRLSLYPFFRALTLPAWLCGKPGVHLGQSSIQSCPRLRDSGVL